MEHDTDQPPISKPGTTRPLAIGVILVMICCFTQVWVVTAGFKGWPVYTDYYRRLTDAFLHGQLNLREGPPPKMLELADPYDPTANARYRLHDASLYDGKYYLYWGPAPALVAAAICWIIRDFDPMFGDQYLVLLYMIGNTILVSILILRTREQLFPNQSPWTAAFAILTFGLGTPVLYTLARSAIYEASIAAGQFFLLAGILAAWFGVQNKKNWALALAGACWALSAGSRIGLVPAIGVFALMTAWQLRGSNWRSSMNIAALLAPLLIGASLHAWYNYVRFGSVTEIGLHYQLANENQHAMPDSALAGPQYITSNILRYLFTPPYRIALFPYMTAQGQMPVEQAFRPAGKSRSETVVGLVWSQPFLLFALPGLIFLWRKRDDPNHALQNWLALMLLSGALLGIAPALTIHGSTMRYLLDAVPCAVILGALGFWMTVEYLSLRKLVLREVMAVTRLFTLIAVMMGVLLSFYGYYSHFPMFNPGLYNALRSRLPVLMWWHST